jgi:hypothetical protein
MKIIFPVTKYSIRCYIIVQTVDNILENIENMIKNPVP